MNPLTAFGKQAENQVDTEDRAKLKRERETKIAKRAAKLAARERQRRATEERAIENQAWLDSRAKDDRKALREAFGQLGGAVVPWANYVTAEIDGSRAVAYTVRDGDMAGAVQRARQAWAGSVFASITGRDLPQRLGCQLVAIDPTRAEVASLRAQEEPQRTRSRVRAG